MTPAFPAPAWLVGCGNMAGAMVEGWRSAGVDFAGVTVIRPSGTPVEGVRTVTDYPATSAPRFVMLGFKPQKLDEVAPGLAPHVGTDDDRGVDAGRRRAPRPCASAFPQARAIVRAMPNLPVAQRPGVTALYCADGDQERCATVERADGFARA